MKDHVGMDMVHVATLKSECTSEDKHTCTESVGGTEVYITFELARFLDHLSEDLRVMSRSVRHHVHGSVPLHHPVADRGQLTNRILGIERRRREIDEQAGKEFEDMARCLEAFIGSINKGKEFVKFREEQEQKSKGDKQ